MCLLPVATATAESESATSSNKAKKVIPENSDSGADAGPPELLQNSTIFVEEEEEAKSKSKIDADANALLLLAEEELLADEIAKETIEAGRGHRDERGVRDQWESDEHLTSESISKFDTRKGRPISNDVKRLLKQYRLECNDCDHNEAVQKVNNYVRETKRLTKLEKERKEKYDRWSYRIFTSIIIIGLSLAYIYQKEILTTLLGNDYETRIRRMVTSGGNGGGGSDLSGFTETQRTEIMRLRRQHASDAATKRQQQEASTAVQPPTWLDNEKKEIWTSKQEKQFQKACREYSGVPKKERYKLIAEKVDDKSRIECLTHHRMIELLEKQQQQQQQ
ncbi:hypothetical protein FRACYDRAFT_251228 [Fragilariopsis cylindrus CCMP1102]|uniref:Myb-like domain-containing protein n=1 Tax=Fragilariopsis cylindrus CCMP1102 TaxID=635003 RepID=A0A1E7EPE5_9STRA|nr:hypothetical protein FRACYDRAFT_251228 [Fragilariopsis cylindrus CCMP1102]|eukprot:OEU07423.1 hypothetical protein FRACYDRAFT_251228 [Fragilariopsis cylindrus CCMP1102]